MEDHDVDASEYAGHASGMLAISNEQGKITISFLISDFPAQDVEELVAFLKAEFIARQSRLSEQEAFALAEEFKTDWWRNNQARILAKAGE